MTTSLFTPARRTTLAALTTGGAVAAVLATGVAPAQAATSSDFSRLRQCESGGDYSINTGNGFYGAYQFDAQTWRGLGYPGLPSAAAPATQDDAAIRLQAVRGWSPWPACSAALGLGSGGGSGAGAGAAVSAPAQTAAPARTAKPAPAKVAPAKPDLTMLRTTTFRVPLSLAQGGNYRVDVASLQEKLAARGYDVAVDGLYGPQTAAGVALLQIDFKQLVSGSVDEPTWALAFSAATPPPA